MPSLRDILDAAVGDYPWYHADYGEIRTKQPDEIRLIALAPELAALVLDMGAVFVRLLDRDHHGDFINGENAKPEDVAALLARLDRIGKEQT